MPHPNAALSADVLARADVTPSALEVVEAFVTTGHVLHRFAERVASAHLSGPRARVLLVVGESGGLRMGDLAATLGITARTVTTMVDALEKDGLLARRGDPADRRATLLMLTAAGQARLKEIEALQREVSDIVLTPLDAEQRCQLLDLLRKLKDHAGAHLGNGAHPRCE